mmetsp:Transcript_10676/g.19753  ORF Transcript_10676/g.19753 Transcript_10676/m.19753 type:complete len:247 (-) Transcript_10676:4-744(-)
MFTLPKVTGPATCYNKGLLPVQVKFLSTDGCSIKLESSNSILPPGPSCDASRPRGVQRSVSLASIRVQNVFLHLVVLSVARDDHVRPIHCVLGIFRNSNPQPPVPPRSHRQLGRAVCNSHSQFRTSPQRHRRLRFRHTVQPRRHRHRSRHGPSPAAHFLPLASARRHARCTPPSGLPAASEPQNPSPIPIPIPKSQSHAATPAAARCRSVSLPPSVFPPQAATLATRFWACSSKWDWWVQKLRSVF